MRQSILDEATAHLARPRARSLALLAALACGAEAAGQERATWSDFPVFVWRQERAAEALDPRFASAFGATNLGRGEDAAPLLERKLAFYVDNAAGRNELHLDRDRAHEERWNAWYETRDDALLVREPCLNDPAVRARLRATLERTLKEPSVERALGVSLGDEVSWTPYGSPEDTCLCEPCRALWREFLAGAIRRGESTLPAGFELSAASTDAARLALEQGVSAPVHAWLLRREFTQSVMQERLRELAALGKSLRPELPQGLLGMIGRTAFGGVAVDGALSWLDFAEGYRVGDARELLFTLRGPRQRVVQTIFFDENNRSTPVWFAWESWMRGADGLVIWSDKELRAHPGYLEGLARAVARIRGVREREPRFAPRPVGVAVVEDGPSIAYGWLVDAKLDGPTWPKRLQGWQEDRGSRERSLRAWLRVLEDCGAMPGALPLERVGAATVREFPLLVLNHLRVLGPDGGRRLEEFLAAGGTLAVRGELGALDFRAERPARPWLERLREKHAARVVELGAELDLYLGERIEGGTALRARIGELLARAGARTAPWRASATGARLPWLSTWTELGDGSVLGAALPNLAEAPERDAEVGLETGPRHPRLAPLELRIEPLAERELEWLNPPDATGDACVLPAGEAAVFRLKPPARK